MEEPLTTRNGLFSDYDRRFGLIAVQRQYMTRDELRSLLLVTSVEADTPSWVRTLPEVVSERGLMSDHQIDLVMNEMFAWRDMTPPLQALDSGPRCSGCFAS